MNCISLATRPELYESENLTRKATSRKLQNLDEFKHFVSETLKNNSEQFRAQVASYVSIYELDYQIFRRRIAEAK